MSLIFTYLFAFLVMPLHSHQAHVLQFVKGCRRLITGSRGNRRGQRYGADTVEICGLCNSVLHRTNSNSRVSSQGSVFIGFYTGLSSRRWTWAGVCWWVLLAEGDVLRPAGIITLKQITAVSCTTMSIKAGFCLILCCLNNRIITMETDAVLMRSLNILKGDCTAA